MTVHAVARRLGVHPFGVMRRRLGQVTIGIDLRTEERFSMPLDEYPSGTAVPGST